MLTNRQKNAPLLEIIFRYVSSFSVETAKKTSFIYFILFYFFFSKTKQAKMAQYCRDIFKEKLLLEPLSSHPVSSFEQKFSTTSKPGIR